MIARAEVRVTPASIGLSPNHLHAHALAGDEDVLLERGQGLVEFELLSTVVGLGRRGQNLDDQLEIDRRVGVFGSANDDDDDRNIG